MERGSPDGGSEERKSRNRKETNTEIDRRGGRENPEEQRIKKKKKDEHIGKNKWMLESSWNKKKDDWKKWEKTDLRDDVYKKKRR